ncbi:hypothetical protein SAMN06265379_110121 [Saccharicrinis carchari]|uniref:Ribbon-helix-helix protein, copG family n=1 Tax=Saccharicrinis carchari TaxID=1168039 RepID=A0A521EQY2_SACCC|nr:ribbon-helix-helix domain-containing protein [Saccharicrinis carchari]SMO86317.1 hypothetical protein SAMN06265379_110121 [Saccharicrinis carchari]
MAKKKHKKDKKSGDRTISSSFLRRTHQVTVLLNEKEKEAIDSYCKKYNITNKSKFIRETIIRQVMDTFLTDYPTLFDKEDMDKIKVTSKPLSPFA